jgi:regulator of sirC expression with transglutaminase-like and TPR domain
MTHPACGQAVLSLEKYSSMADEDINLGNAAIDLAGIFHEGRGAERYFSRLEKLARDVGERHAALIAAGEADRLETRLAALKYVLSDIEGYGGNRENYDDIANADMMEVIDRHKGMPISLSILYIELSRRNGWSAHGLNLPGHFVARLDLDGQRLIYDPYNHCAILGAPDLRRIVKQALGPHAELSATYYEPATNREILIRLMNNIKIRQIETEDYAGAVRTVEAMRMLDPHEYRLLLDAGVLYARTDQHRKAKDLLEAYIDKAPHSRDRQEAALLLQHLNQFLR